MQKRREKKWAWAAALAGVAAAAGPSGAFYWYGVPERTVLGPADRDKPGNPPGSGGDPNSPPGVGVVPPGGNPTQPPGGPATPGGSLPPTQVPGEVKGESPPGVFVPEGPGAPPGVPEPGTLLAAVAGLAAVAAGRVRRRRSG